VSGFQCPTKTQAEKPSRDPSSLHLQPELFPIHHQLDKPQQQEGDHLNLNPLDTPSNTPSNTIIDTFIIEPSFHTIQIHFQ
jgi:hypothetical protein